MEKNKTEQYTFGPDEKEILEILGTFQQEFEERPQSSKSEIKSVEYYEIFEVERGEIEGVFVTVEQSQEGMISYHLYFQSPQNEICSIDSEGNIEINQQWKDLIGVIDFEKCLQNNREQVGRLKGISEKVEPNKMEKALEKNMNDLPKKEQEDDEPEEQIQNDIGGQEDLRISYYRKIKDNNFGEQIGMNLNGYQEIGLAFSQSKNAFILVGKKDGAFEQVEGFELAQPTFKTVMSIDEKGQSVKKEVPHAIMETNNPNKELSITIGQYGYIEVGTIDRLPCDERVKRQVREQGETEKGGTSTQLNTTIRTNGVGQLHEWAHDNSKIHDSMNNGEPRETNVTREIANEGENQYIPGTKVTWRAFANACGYRGEGAIVHAQEVFRAEQQKNQNMTSEELVVKIQDDKMRETPYGDRKQV